MLDLGRVSMGISSAPYLTRPKRVDYSTMVPLTTNIEQQFELP